MSSKKDRTSVQRLKLTDAPRTWFHWNGSEHNVETVPADIFDAWIREYVDVIEDVDTATWEIFQRWGIINAVIADHLLMLKNREDGSQILEAFSSELTSGSEEKASDENTGETASKAAGA